MTFQPLRRTSCDQPFKVGNDGPELCLSASFLSLRGPAPLSVEEIAQTIDKYDGRPAHFCSLDLTVGNQLVYLRTAQTGCSDSRGNTNRDRIYDSASKRRFGHGKFLRPSPERYAQRVCQRPCRCCNGWQRPMNFDQSLEYKYKRWRNCVWDCVFKLLAEISRATQTRMGGKVRRSFNF